MKVILLSLLILSLTSSSSASIKDIFSNIFSKNQCPIKLYNPKDSSFTGQKIYANANTFDSILKTLSSYAKECRVKINVKQSFIQESPAMSTIMLRDHGAMAFRLGEAIEFELVDQDNKVLCNRICMEKDPSRLSGLPDAKCFLQKLARNSDIRQDAIKPTIIMKKPKPTETLLILHDQRKELQNKCKSLKMN